MFQDKRWDQDAVRHRLCMEGLATVRPYMGARRLVEVDYDVFVRLLQERDLDIGTLLVICICFPFSGHPSMKGLATVCPYKGARRLAEVDHNVFVTFLDEEELEIGMLHISLNRSLKATTMCSTLECFTSLSFVV